MSRSATWGRAPDPFSPRTLRSIRVAWAAADIERAGHQWIASRELALAPGRWGAQVANERGGRSRRLPDLVFWPTSDGRLPVAVVVVQGQSNPRRERVALEGWQASIATGRYAQVRYVAGPAAAFDSGGACGAAERRKLINDVLGHGERPRIGRRAVRVARPCANS